jgi:hypothetical protein
MRLAKHLCQVGREAARCADPTLAAALPVLAHVTSLHAGRLRYHPSGVAPSPVAAQWQAYQPRWVTALHAALARMPALRALNATIDLSRDDPINALARANLPAPPPPWPAPLAALERLTLTVAPPPRHSSADPLFLAPLRRLSALSLTYGTPALELESPFTAARAREIATLPALLHLSLTVVNHGFEQDAADSLAAAACLTSLELLRCVPSVPMNFFEFHNGVRFLAGMRSLRRLKLNDARFICQGAAASWSPLAALSHLETLAVSGAPRLCTASPAYVRSLHTAWSGCAQLSVNS